MTIKTEQFTRVTYACDVCERTSPPIEVNNFHYEKVPDGWKQFGLGKFVKTYCPACCARHMLGHFSHFTIGEVIDAALALDEAIVPKEKQAC